MKTTEIPPPVKTGKKAAIDYLCSIEQKVSKQPIKERRVA